MSVGFFLFKFAEGCKAAKALLYTLSWWLDFDDKVGDKLVHAQIELLFQASPSQDES